MKIEMSEKTKGDFEIKISDNGKGMPPEFDFEKSASLGMEIVKILCKQVQGNCALSSNNKGTVFSIKIDNEKFIASHKKHS